jgi:hypothetical protein
MKMLIIDAVKCSMKFALHDAMEHGNFAAKNVFIAELMSENSPLVPLIFW